MDSCKAFSISTIPFLVALNFTLAMSTNPTYMRCYCNLAECVERGENLCKSRTGCFQELPHYNLPQPLYRRLNIGKGQTPITPVPNTELRLGCLELWPSDSAPFQCTEPGIRKSPHSDSFNRRQSTHSSDYDLDDSDPFISNGRIKNGDRLNRRRSSSNRHSQHKLAETRRWSANDVPLRCCIGDMCNRRNHATNGPKSIGMIGSISTVSQIDSGHPTSTPISVDSHHWWLTSTMIFVPVIGAIIFFLLVALGCWILHSGNGNSCRNRNRSKSVSIPAHYYFYESSALKTTATDDSIEKTNLKACKCVVVETSSTNLGNVAGSGRCALILPIFLSKYNQADCVVNVKTADTRTLGL